MITYVWGPFRRESKTLQQRVVVGVGTKLVPFDVQIYWSKQSESVIEFVHGGVKFKEGATFNDYYGFMTSKEAGIAEAKQIAQRLSVTAESSLVLVVRTKVYEIPFIRTSRCEVSNLKDDTRKHVFEDIPNDWYDGETRLEAQVLEIQTWKSNE